ncbi:hypothetical protein U1Q18_033264 [Sarracenia purpurea var. burkii]
MTIADNLPQDWARTWAGTESSRVVTIPSPGRLGGFLRLPTDGHQCLNWNIMDKALDALLQVSVLKYFDLCICSFITTKGLKPFAWDYKEEDYQLISKILASNFRNKWLTVKKKLKAVGGSKSDGEKKFKKGGDLDTIHEDLDLDESNMTFPEHYSTSLAVEWAH